MTFFYIFITISVHVIRGHRGSNTRDLWSPEELLYQLSLDPVFFSNLVELYSLSFLHSFNSLWWFQQRFPEPQVELIRGSSGCIFLHTWLFLLLTLLKSCGVYTQVVLLPKYYYHFFVPSSKPRRIPQWSIKCLTSYFPFSVRGENRKKMLDMESLEIINNSS